MAKREKLMKAFEAFVNNDLDKATEHYRQFFIESAQEINAKLEEDFGGDMEEDLYDEVGVEDEDMDEMEDSQDMDDEEDEDFSEFEEMDFEDDEDMDDEDLDSEEDEAPSEEEWEDLEDAFGELEALFNEISGDDEVKESFDYKKVAQPSMHETDADNTHSPVAGEAKSPVGVDAKTGFSKDGVVKGSNVKAEYGTTG